MNQALADAAIQSCVLFTGTFGSGDSVVPFTADRT